MAIKKIPCRFGKIVIEKNIVITPTKRKEKMKELFPKEHYDLHSSFNDILWRIDLGNELGERISPPPLPSIPLALARFEGSVCNSEILRVLRENDLLDTTVPEEDMLSVISYYASSPPIDNILYTKNFMHNLFLLSENEIIHKVVIENRSQKEDKIHWYLFEDFAYEGAFHISTERLFFPIKKSALPQ